MTHKELNDVLMREHRGHKKDRSDSDDSSEDDNVEDYADGGGNRRVSESSVNRLGSDEDDSDSE